MLKKIIKWCKREKNQAVQDQSFKYDWRVKQQRPILGTSRIFLVFQRNPFLFLVYERSSFRDVVVFINFPPISTSFRHNHESRVSTSRYYSDYSTEFQRIRNGRASAGEHLLSKFCWYFVTPQISPLWNSLVLEQFRRRDPSAFIAIKSVHWVMDTDKRGSFVSLSIPKRIDRKFSLRNWKNAFPKYFDTDDKVRSLKIHFVCYQRYQRAHHDYKEFRFIATKEDPKLGLFISLGIFLMPIVSALNVIFYTNALIAPITSVITSFVVCLFLIFTTVITLRSRRGPIKLRSAGRRIPSFFLK